MAALYRLMVVNQNDFERVYRYLTNAVNVSIIACSNRINKVKSKVNISLFEKLYLSIIDTTQWLWLSLDMEMEMHFQYWI